EVGGLGGDLDAGDLTQELASSIRCGVHRVEDDVSHVAHTELKAIIALEALAINFLAIDVGSVFAALVDDEQFTVFGADVGVIAGDARIGDDEILVYFSADGEGRVI